MTFSPITAIDQLTGSGPFSSRLGGLLNVNAGSIDTPANLGYGGYVLLDACLFAGQMTTVHVEIDGTMSYPWGPKAVRGPYVQTWNGAAWVVMGATLDPAADTVPAANGTRFKPIEPRIATDGSSLFVAYYDFVLTNIGSGAGNAFLRIAKWNGAVWVEVASDPGGGSVIGITVAGGVAYTVRGTGGVGSLVRVFRSDGVGYNLPDSGNAYNGHFGGGAPAAITTRTGRPVGFYNYYNFYNASQIWPTMFDLDTGAVMRRTPNVGNPPPTVPYATTNPYGITNISGNACLYASDQIAIGDASQGILVIPEDGSADFTSISGDGLVRLSGFPGTFDALAQDLTKPDQIWAFPGGDGEQSNLKNVWCWQEACSATRIAGNPINVAPQHSIYFQSAAQVYGQGPDYFFGQSFFSTAAIVTDGSNVYTFYMYYPAGLTVPPTPPIQYKCQFAVDIYPIQRGGGFCGQINVPVFRNRHKVTQ